MVEHFAGRRRRHLAEVGWFALQLQQRREHHHTTFAVRDGVVHLHDERRLLALQTGDDSQFPQRPRTVEVFLGDALSHFQHVGQICPGALWPGPTDVVAHVEVGIGFPAGWHQRNRVADDTGPQFGVSPGHALHPVEDHVGIRHRIEHADQRDGGAQDWIHFDVPHHSGEGTHARFDISHGGYLARWSPLVATAATPTNDPVCYSA